jgi:hypothetical protein
MTTRIAGCGGFATGSERVAALPATPTAAESEYPGYEDGGSKVL